MGFFAQKRTWRYSNAIKSINRERARDARRARFSHLVDGLHRALSKYQTDHTGGAFNVLAILRFWTKADKGRAKVPTKISDKGDQIGGIRL